MRREELKILADELLREVDAAAIDTANVSIASALEHLCELERAWCKPRLGRDLRRAIGAAAINRARRCKAEPAHDRRRLAPGYPGRVALQSG